MRCLQITDHRWLSGEISAIREAMMQLLGKQNKNTNMTLLTVSYVLHLAGTQTVTQIQETEKVGRCDKACVSYNVINVCIKCKCNQ